MAEKPATVTRNALLDVFLPAMREFIRVKFYAHLLEQEGQSSNLTRAEKLEKAAAWHAEVLKCLPKPRREQIRGNLGRAQRAEDQIEIGDLSHIFRERDDLFPDAFRPGGRLHNGLLPLQDTRNESVHQLVETWALTKAIRVLETCRDILNACGTSDTADLANDINEEIKRLDNGSSDEKAPRAPWFVPALVAAAIIMVGIAIAMWQLWPDGDAGNPEQAATSNPPQTAIGDDDSSSDEPTAGGETTEGGPEQQGGSTSTPIEPPPPDTNSPPACDDIEGFALVEGEEQQVSVSCSDGDGDTITLSVSADSQTNYRISPDTGSVDGQGTQQFTITALRSSSGTSYVEIKADDGNGGIDMVRFSVVVDADEDEPTSVEPPKIEGGISCAPSLVAVNVSVTCEVVLSEGTPPFTYEWSDSDGGSGGNEDYSTSFRSPGEKTVQLTVRNSANSGNSANSDSDLTKVTVFNRSPEQVDSIPPLTVGKGWGSDEVELGSYFRDQDGDNLTYTATSSNEDCVRPRVVGRNDDELTITGHCEGSATITVIASDGNGGETEQIFIARVVPRPSWFVYCLPNTTSIYYLRGAHGTKHQIDITRSQAEGLWGSSFWDEIAIMSSSDCARWPTGSPYDYDDARREVERA